MNSVFSAFKTNKNEGKQKLASKRLTPDSSYENLKHIRDIGSSSKMTDFVDDSDGICSGVATQIIRLNSPSSIDDEINDSADVVDHKTVIVDYIENYHPINKSLHLTDNADACTNMHTDRLVENESADTKSYSCQTNEQNVTHVNQIDLSKANNQNTPQLPPSGPLIKVQSASTSENQKVPIIVSTNATDTNSITNKAKRFQHRLSLKCNPTLPSVHGRPSSTNSDTKKKSRLSNHQRNLSLDFRYIYQFTFSIIFTITFVLQIYGNLVATSVTSNEFMHKSNTASQKS